MNARERILAIAVLGAVVLAGLAVMAYQFFVVPLEDRKRSLMAVTKDVGDKQKRIDEIVAKRAKLNVWRQLSLPADVNQASREYTSYLRDLMTRSRFAPGPSISPKTETQRISAQAGKKEPPFTKLIFDVTATATLDNLVDMLEQFYHTSLLHKIDKLEITRQLTGGAASGPNASQRRGNDLNIKMQIEALVLTGAGKRGYLLPSVDRVSLAQCAMTNLQGGPGALALVPYAVGVTGPLGPRRLATEHREYAAIAGKNVFYGAAPVERARDSVDVTQFVFLNQILKTVSRSEAILYNRYINRDYRLRETAGYNTFIIRDDEDEPLVQGTVVRIDEKDVYFKAGDKYYAIHAGQSIKEAMRRTLKEEELKTLGVAVANPAPAPAAQ